MGIRAGTGRRRNLRLSAVILVSCIAFATSCGSDQVSSPARPTPDDASTTPSSATSSTRPSRSAEAHNGGGRLAAPVDADAPPVQIDHAALTSPTWATYGYSTDSHKVTASMPPGSNDGNIREVFWRAGTVPASDEQICITWDQTSESVEGEPIQPGLAMRIASVGPRNEGLRAITLTENVVYAGTWLFNVHVWDTRLPVPMTLVQTFDVSRVVGRIAKVDGRAANLMVKPPWHLCGRTVGDTFTFKVWTQKNPEPSWDDPHQVFSVQLPSGWDYPGYAGGYIGHLHPGQTATGTAELPSPID